MVEPASDQPDFAVRRRPNAWLSWLVLFLLGTASITLVAVYLPPRVKMLGLFAILQGLLTGWLALRLALVFELPAKKALAAVVVFLVILGGLVGTAVESHRLYRAAAERARGDHPQRAAVLRMLQRVKLPNDQQSRKLALDLRRTIGDRGTSFADYLQFRVSEVGIRSRYLAGATWTLEVGLVALAGTWLFRRLAKAPRLERP